MQFGSRHQILGVEWPSGSHDGWLCKRAQAWILVGHTKIKWWPWRIFFTYLPYNL